ncbi:phosphodiester glycosidase family protein [Mariniplasma anaerobium]|uniref:Phosphodiester glycosidase domain-containing protein n=1 Tax=Mariniplasma anaerobium TaxID=2735436 RepID=A0A7U9TIB7_9MOLU|nr:phosphodiester glycosidase family protein [Mariniplasma anaerobium]BCR36840.1 hypothetical protein MPAN_017330 [Mariniplasma anaerobium]
MKKIFIFILLMVISLGIFDAPSAHAYFRINEDTKITEYKEGIRHTKIIGSINDDGVETNQVMNYVSANVMQNSDINIVVGDNYSLHQDENDKWNMSNILGLIENVHSRYDNFEVLAGVNGDFYDINDTGRPIAAHIRNFEVVSRGDANRPLVGFKDNGEVVFGKPDFDGYELLVFNDEGQLKNKLDVDHINSDPQNNDEISVYFDNYLSALPDEYNKVHIDSIETKITESYGNYFGKGSISQLPTSEDIEENQFVIVGYEFNSDQLITESDYVVVQANVINTFEDVRFALGTDSQPLVIDGQANTGLNGGAAWNYVAPRTAVGIKADGTVFFMVVDGRNKPMGMEGVTLPALGEIMAYYGAEDAFNLDGGGSSTLALIDDEADEGYVILNTPSDGRLRSISNGVFFVKGEFDPIPVPIPEWPDTRDQLNMPTNIFVDQDGILRFNAIPGSISYSVVIDGRETIVESNQLELDLAVGMHEISVRAKGGADFISSTYSQSILYQVYPHDINLLIDMIKDFTKSELND